MGKLHEARAALSLKEMDGTLLSQEILFYSSDQARVRSAIDLASYLHREQRRKNRGDLPRTHYIEHPLRNAARVARWGIHDDDLLIAAILHDTIEDCLLDLLLMTDDFATPANIGGREHCRLWYAEVYGERVANIIWALTNSDEIIVGRTRPEKRADYVAHVERAIVDPEVALEKLSDFIDNGAGLRHNALDAENFAMVRHLAIKYRPLVAIFALRIVQADFVALVGLKTVKEMALQLIDAGNSLTKLLNEG